MLTPTGREKLARILTAVREAAQAAAPQELVAMRARAAEAAPEPDEEARLISSGVPTSGRWAGLTVGWDPLGFPGGSRFMQSIPTRQAILLDPVELEEQGDRFMVATCSASRINQRTVFKWMTRRRGEQGPSAPFNFRWIETLENGGTWRVVPRGPWPLEPWPRVIVDEVIKTVAPRSMFARARWAGREIARQKVRRAVQGAARAASTSA